MIWGLKTVAIFDFWTFEHFLSGISIGTIAIRCNWKIFKKQFHINKEVEKVIIENATAKGIRLNDGTEIGARKLIVSTLNPNQLVFDLIGREHVEDKLARRVELLENVFGCIMWYSFAVHEKPRYRAGAFNPDINETEWLGLQPDPDPIHIARECRHAKLLQWPPPKDDYCPTVWCNSMVDPSYAPEGKHVLQNEQLGPPASMFSEKQWLEIGEQYARDLVDLWKDYAPNMTWDIFSSCSVMALFMAGWLYP